MPISRDIRREQAKQGILEAFKLGEPVVFVTQTKSTITKNVMDSINPVGCLCHVTNIDAVGDVLKVQADGFQRVQILETSSDGKIDECKVNIVKPTNTAGKTKKKHKKTEKQKFDKFTR